MCLKKVSSRCSSNLKQLELTNVRIVHNFFGTQYPENQLIKACIFRLTLVVLLRYLRIH